MEQKKGFLLFAAFWGGALARAARLPAFSLCRFFQGDFRARFRGHFRRPFLLKEAFYSGMFSLNDRGGGSLRFVIRGVKIGGLFLK
ncbi:MAG: hypothetical protein KH382_11110 [Clostridiales bacterium]|nr:hypothetical protein [Clostridiales bacterium]